MAGIPLPHSRPSTIDSMVPFANPQLAATRQLLNDVLKQKGWHVTLRSLFDPPRSSYAFIRPHLFVLS